MQSIASQKRRKRSLSMKISQPRKPICTVLESWRPHLPIMFSVGKEGQMLIHQTRHDHYCRSAADMPMPAVHPNQQFNSRPQHSTLWGTADPTCTCNIERAMHWCIKDEFMVAEAGLKNSTEVENSELVEFVFYTWILSNYQWNQPNWAEIRLNPPNL
jgi:hypothetical protein